MLLDLEAMLQPVRPAEPCGSEIRHEPLFDELVEAAEPGVEFVEEGGREVARPRPRDWRRIRRDALELAGRGHDLRLLLLLARALTVEDGYPGLAAGLGLIRRALELYWDTLWPALDSLETVPAEQAFHRLNTLRQLADGERLLAELRRAPLARARGLGQVTLRDLDLAARRLTPAAGEAVPDPALLDAVFQAAEAATLQPTLEAVRTAALELQALERLLADRLGDPSLVPDLAPLARLVAMAEGELARRLPAVATDRAAEPGPEAGAAVEAPVAAGAAPSAGAAGGPLRVRDRAEVIRALDLVLDYYRLHEPASPVPLLLGRAKRLVPMSFMQVLEELAPAAVEQARLVGGKEEAP